MDPYPRGPDWMPITPKTGSLFHAELQYALLEAFAAEQVARMTSSPKRSRETPSDFSRSTEGGRSCDNSSHNR